MVSVNSAAIFISLSDDDEVLQATLSRRNEVFISYRSVSSRIFLRLVSKGTIISLLGRRIVCLFDIVMIISGTGEILELFKELKKRSIATRIEVSIGVSPMD